MLSPLQRRRYSWMPIRPNAHARGEVNRVSAGNASAKSCPAIIWKLREGRTSHAYAQRPERSAMAVLGPLWVQPLPVETQVVMEALRLGIECMMQECGGGGGQPPHGFRVLAQFRQQHRENESARIIVSAIAFGKIRHAENRVLEDSGGIGHPQQMAQAYFRQLPRLLIQRLGGQELSRTRRHFQARTLERCACTSAPRCSRSSRGPIR